jgi:hypothetical protein
MSNPSMTARLAPPTKHQLALMIWLAVFPTLTVINLVFGEQLATLYCTPSCWQLSPYPSLSTGLCRTSTGSAPA